MTHENPKEKPKSIPFEGLGDSQYSERVKKLQKNPHLLVREWELDDRHARGSGKKLSEGNTREKAIENFKRGIKIFQTLHEKYDIAIPRMDLVIGRKEKNGPETMYTVTDRIYGESLEETNILPIEALDKIDRFFVGLSKYFADVFKNGGDFWSDFNNSQVMWGHKNEEKENQMYVVDIEPRFEFYRPSENSSRLLDLLAVMAFEVKMAEKTFVPRQKFVHTRKVLEELTSDMILKGGAYKKTALNMRESMVFRDALGYPYDK